MREVSKEYPFDAARKFHETLGPNASRRIYGYCLHTEFVVRADADPESGTVVDLGLLGRAMEKARDRFDCSLLVDINDRGLGTMEKLFSWIWRKLRPVVCLILWRVNVFRDSDSGACGAEAA